MKKIIFILIFAILTSSCGYKVVKRGELANYDITEITSTGDKRVNFKIKNKLLLSSNRDEKKLISINLNTKKNKIIKEKNIKNEVTKYTIGINIEVEIKQIDKINFEKFSVSKSGDYDVSSQYSQTLNNEKKVTDLLTDKLSDEILNELGQRLNDN